MIKASPSCSQCEMMPEGEFCLSHTCPDCGNYSADVETHHCPGTVTYVAALPSCDFCRHPSGGAQHVPAAYDFKTKRGPWAFGCQSHWESQRAFESLGTGKGQLLLIAGVSAVKEES